MDDGKVLVVNRKGPIGEDIVKTIRVSGRINQHDYCGDDPPIEPHYDLVIENVSQLEVVD